MRQVIGCVLLLAATFILGAPSAAAQGAKKGAKDGTFEIGEGKDGKFRYNVRDGEGKFLAGSAAYATAKDAQKGIDSFKTVVSKGKVTTAPKKGKEKTTAKEGTLEIGEGKDGKFRYNVRDGEGKFLAGSAAYATAKDAREAIAGLKKLAPTAKIVTTAAKKKDKGN